MIPAADAPMTPGADAPMIPDADVQAIPVDACLLYTSDAADE